MGDLQTDQGESLDLQFVPVDEFRRVIGAKAPVADRARAFAALARINTLYMITGAWSGHIGTSFSSIEIMSWLFLNELRDLDRGPGCCDIFFSSKGHDAPALYAVLLGLGSQVQLVACPFCAATEPTWAERREAAEVARGAGRAGDEERDLWATRRRRGGGR